MLILLGTLRIYDAQLGSLRIDFHGVQPWDTVAVIVQRDLRHRNCLARLADIADGKRVPGAIPSIEEERYRAGLVTYRSGNDRDVRNGLEAMA